MADFKFAPRARTIDRQSVALDDEWGDVYDLGRIDDLAVYVQTNPAQVRFSPKLPNGGVDWEEPVTLRSGGTTTFDQGTASGFGLFQLRRATAGSASTVSFTGFCRG